MSKKILVVDDEKDVLSVLVFRLKKAGYNVLTAEDGQEALRVINDEKPDIILLDIKLPGMDGIEVAKNIKNDDKLKEIPILLLSASVEDIGSKVGHTGARDFIKKPFIAKDVLDKVKKYTL